jgi:mono/diheme cytochrome c family protein
MMICALLVLITTATAMAAPDLPDIDDLRPGLVFTATDSATPPVTVGRLEPSMALTLLTGESAHPRLSGDRGQLRWDGYLNVLRAGEYRFSTWLRGRLRLTIDDKPVLTAEEIGATATLKSAAQPLRLEAGVHRIAATFERMPGLGRVQILWQSQTMSQAPLAADLLFHAPRWLDAGQPFATVRASQKADHGRYLAEEFHCLACHKPADNDKLAKGLNGRSGPDLSQVGGRVHVGWIFRWLAAPAQVRPGAVMPRLFTDDERGRTERYAVARYLASLGGPVPAQKAISANDYAKSAANGNKLFGSIGCSICHRDDKKLEPAAIHGFLGARPARSVFPLADLADKTTVDRLASFLQNPHAVDPSGRMPNLLLNQQEAIELARFLCKPNTKNSADDLPQPPANEQRIAAFKAVDDRPAELETWQRLPADLQWVDLGKRLVIEKGCNNCHTLAPGGKPFANIVASASFDDLKKITSAKGCLAKADKDHGKAPRFVVSDAEVDSLLQFLKQGTTGAGSSAPAWAARVTLQRFNCLGCHQRDGEGGLTPELTESLRRFENAENAEAISPPPLSGVGLKLRTPWLRQVLVAAGRARPWMGLRMPQFGEPHVGRLPESLAFLDGAEADSKVHDIPLSGTNIETGRRLVGKNGFGCVSCHDLAGRPNFGTRGPDLSSMNQRVRHDWYLRWLEVPQRLSPGTRMPTVFPDGKSLLTTILGGRADAQADAIWAYLSLGNNLPMPDGMEPPKGVILAATDRPVILRTFMHDAGSRAIAVGFPGGLSVAFDTNTCRLAYAWTGGFLDASPVWNGRGGSPAHALGQRIWTTPTGCPLAVTTSQEIPDFTTRRLDPALGASPPEGKLVTAPRQLHFDGYTIDKRGIPTFHSQLNTAQGPLTDISERAVPLVSPVAAALGREFSLKLPQGATAWVLAGESSTPPRRLVSDGRLVDLDLKPGRLELPVVGVRLAVAESGGSLAIVGTTQAPDGSRWLLQKQGDRWQMVLRLPTATSAQPTQFTLGVWNPYREEPALLKELATPP